MSRLRMEISASHLAHFIVDTCVSRAKVRRSFYSRLPTAILNGGGLNWHRLQVAGVHHWLRIVDGGLLLWSVRVGRDGLWSVGVGCIGKWGDWLRCVRLLLPLPLGLTLLLATLLLGLDFPSELTGCVDEPNKVINGLLLLLTLSIDLLLTDASLACLFFSSTASGFLLATNRVLSGSVSSPAYFR